MRFLRQEYWSGLLFPLPVDHVLSDLFSEQQHIIWSVSVVLLIWLQVVSWRVSLVLLIWNEEYRSLPSVATFLSINRLKILVYVSLEEEPGPHPRAALLFLSCSCLVSAHPPFSDCCCCSLAQSCLKLCDPMDCSTSGFPILHYSRSLLKLMSVESVMPSNSPLSITFSD